MKEIYDLILLEKTNPIPNKEYIQFLQQMTDKNDLDYFKDEVKRQNFLKDLEKSNTISFDTYFKYSGETEETKNTALIEYEEWVNSHKVLRDTPMHPTYVRKRRDNINNKIK